MDREVSALFDQEFLRRLEGLRLLARQLARGSRRAERRSTHRGVSPEFAEYRAYIPGDDTRYIDWNAYARWRHVVLKLFVEEHDLPVYLLLDCTGSMDWGQPSKFVYARQLAAGLAYLALGNHDRVGIVPLGSPDNLPVPAHRGKDRFWHLLERLAAYGVDRAERSLEAEVRRWLSLDPRRGMAILLSDLFGNSLTDAPKALDRLRYARHETAAVQVWDPQEATAGDRGEYVLASQEGDSRLPVIVDSRIAQAYRERFTHYQDALRQRARELQMPLVQADTSMPVLDLLTRVLREQQIVQ